LAAVTVPTLLVGADPEGAVLRPDLGKRLAATNHLVRYRMIPGSSHSIHRDQYEPFLRLIDEFLRTS
jgi:pimeloyl-ACP methyl ester carboxylesterase